MKQTKPARRYGVHEIFGPTIQGEGGMGGTVCHFVRVSGCNMWDGRLETRQASHCPFCDTDFFSHTLLTADEIVNKLRGLGSVEWVTISGGEPGLQVDENLCDALHREGYKIAIETNGTVPLLGRIDYVTMSPKVSRDSIRPDYADCLKLLYPHPNPAITPDAFNDFEAGSRYIQPITGDTPEVTAANMAGALAVLYRHPNWRLSVQLHKYIGVD